VNKNGVCVCTGMGGMYTGMGFVCTGMGGMCTGMGAGQVSKTCCCTFEHGVGPLPRRARPVQENVHARDLNLYTHSGSRLFLPDPGCEFAVPCARGSEVAVWVST